MRVSQSHQLYFTAAIEEVFPLFTPVHEKRWAVGWDPTIIYAKTPNVEEKGAVFTTQHHDEPLATWVISDYDVIDYRVQYVKFVPERYITLIEIQCSSAEKTTVQVTYTLTALGEKGQDYVQNFTTAYFRHHQMEGWQKAIEHYLKTGETLVSA